MRPVTVNFCATLTHRLTCVFVCMIGIATQEKWIGSLIKTPSDSVRWVCRCVYVWVCVYNLRQLGNSNKYYLNCNED